MQKILEVKNVTKYYGAGSVVTKALDGISLTVEKGEFVAIMGASGSGKSTLLNVVSTIDRVSSGEICVEGRNICSMKEDELSAFRRDKLGFVFQDYNLLDTLTVGENIVLPLNLKRVPEDETKKELRRVAEALAWPTSWKNSLTSCRAVSASAPPARGQSSLRPHSSLRTSRRARSTRKIRSFS